MKGATHYKVQLVTHWQPWGIKTFWIKHTRGRSALHQLILQGLPSLRLRASQSYGARGISFANAMVSGAALPRQTLSL